jgi:hypothetical protein
MNEDMAFLKADVARLERDLAAMRMMQVEAGERAEGAPDGGGFRLQRRVAGGGKLEQKLFFEIYRDPADPSKYGVRNGAFVPVSSGGPGPISGLHTNPVAANLEPISLPNPGELHTVVLEVNYNKVTASSGQAFGEFAQTVDVFEYASHSIKIYSPYDPPGSSGSAATYGQGGVDGCMWHWKLGVIDPDGHIEPIKIYAPIYDHITGMISYIAILDPNEE